jgi:glycosyltransferase involved in cell wall biosynthesis
MIFEHAYRLKLKGFDVSITFKYTEAEFDPTVFPHAQDISIIDYKSKTNFDFAISTFWSTVYDLSDFQANYYLYFCQCDERLFYHEDDTSRFWAEQTYRASSLPVVVPARFLATKLNDEFTSTCIHVPNGIDTSLFTWKNRKPNDHVRVLIEGAGKAWFKKVGDAFQVAQETPNIEIWYVTYDGFVDANWKVDKVFKKVPYQEMPSVYRNCDILLKMSEVESFGLPNLEMMACGGAIITTAFTGHEEYAVDGENSFVVEIGDIRTARERLQELIDSVDLRKKFGENGIKTAAVRDWNTLKPDFADALERIESTHPNGNTDEVLPKLQSLSKAFREHESMMARVKYLERWKDKISGEEKTLPNRIARKVRKWME